MKKITYLFLIITGLCLQNSLVAQIETNYNMYEKNLIFYNPASIAEDSTEVIYINRFKTPNISFNPSFSHSFLSVGYQFKNIKGRFHLNYNFNQYSYFNQNLISLGYSYPVQIGKEHLLSFGTRLIGTFNSIQYEQLSYSNFNQTREVSINPDLDFGVHYKWKGISAAIGLKHLISPKVKKDGIVYIENPLTANFLFSYKHRIKSDWFVKPRVLIYKEYYWTYKPGLNFGLDNKFEAGATFDIPSYHLGYNAGIYIKNSMGIFVSMDHHLITETKHFEIMLKLRL